MICPDCGRILLSMETEATLTEQVLGSVKIREHRLVFTCNNCRYTARGFVLEDHKYTKYIIKMLLERWESEY